jgi:hypothetical protein
LTDHDILELSAVDAPTPLPGYADTTLALAHRARRQRRAAGLGVGLGVAAVAVAAAAMLTPLFEGLRSEAPSAAIIASDSGTRSAEAAVYATAIGALAEKVSAGGPPVLVVYILDHTCASAVVRIVEGGCDRQPLSDSLREDLAADLAAYAPVHYVSDSQEVTDTNLDVVDGGVVVALGPIQISVDHAQVPLAVQRGGLNGRGLTYALTHSGEMWQIDGTVGPQWIS